MRHSRSRGVIERTSCCDNDKPSTGSERAAVVVVVVAKLFAELMRSLIVRITKGSEIQNVVNRHVADDATVRRWPLAVVRHRHDAGERSAATKAASQTRGKASQRNVEPVTSLSKTPKKVLLVRFKSIAQMRCTNPCNRRYTSAGMRGPPFCLGDHERGEDEIQSVADEKHDHPTVDDVYMSVNRSVVNLWGTCLVIIKQLLQLRS